MRDIRSDLQERANLIDEQIRAAYAHFEKTLAQLQNERDAKIADLKSLLAMVTKFVEFEQWYAGVEQRSMGVEQRYMGNVSPAVPTSPVVPTSPAVLTSPAVPTSPLVTSPAVPTSPLVTLADLFMHRLNEAGRMSREELADLAVKEGFFPDAESAVQGVHPMLVNLLRSELVRELENGMFAPPTMSQTIKLRRVI
jgi:hypothetical protein